MLTIEDMQEIDADYELEQSRVMSGDDDRERFVTENDIEDCVHSNSTIFTYGEKSGTEFKVWECRDCGNVGEVGKEN